MNRLHTSAYLNSYLSKILKRNAIEYSNKNPTIVAISESRGLCPFQAPGMMRNTAELLHLDNSMVGRQVKSDHYSDRDACSNVHVAGGAAISPRPYPYLDTGCHISTRDYNLNVQFG